MHIKAFAALLGLSVTACTGVIDGGGTGGGGDDEPTEGCGDSITQAGEACDDGNTISGDGCSASCQTENLAMPRLNATLDTPTLTTENGRVETVTLTLTSVDGFTGTINVAPAFVDMAGAPVPNVEVTGPTSITVAADDVVPSQFLITLPSNTTGSALSAKLKLTLSGAATDALEASVNVDNILTITNDANTGAGAATHPLTNKTIVVKRGTRVRIKNTDTMDHVTHGDGAWDHENTAAGAPGGMYEVDTIGSPPGSSGTLGCHTHGAATYGELRTE